MSGSTIFAAGLKAPLKLDPCGKSDLRDLRDLTCTRAVYNNQPNAYSENVKTGDKILLLPSECEKDVVLKVHLEKQQTCANA